MKKQNTQGDKSAPYRTTGFERIVAPTGPKSEPKAGKITTDGDLRSKK